MSWHQAYGGLPFHEWAEDVTEREYPLRLWRQAKGYMPYKLGVASDVIQEKEYPISMWTQSYGSLPKKAWPSLYEASPPVHQENYVCVYDMVNPQNEFDHNGLCILDPTVCEITEELNGAYELTLVHPIDENGKWRYLLEMNIIKANGQLFRIYKKTTSSATRERTVYARHIFYDLNDKILDDVRPVNKNGHDFIQHIIQNMFVDDPTGMYIFYNYSYDSDITETATAYYQMVTPVGALIGEDNCFLNRFGGEIHRDNFYFSINKNKEGSIAHTDAIRYGVDMLEIEETVDYSELVTYAIFRDNYGGGWASSYVGLPQLAHNITRIFRNTYGEDYEFADLIRDGKNYFDSVYTPKISYSIRFANLKNTELYREFIELQNYNVGDTVPVYCEELDIVTEQKVVKKVIDALTKDTVSIDLGNLRGGLTRKDKYGNTISSGSMSAAEKEAQALQQELRKTKLKLFATWGTAETSTWAEAEEFTWAEVEEV